MSDTRWMNDRQFTELPLESVRREGNGYALTRQEDFGTLFIDDPGFQPKPGEMCRFYGEGIGRPVRGVVINGRVARYQTAEEHDAEWQRQREKWEAENRARDEAVKVAGRDEATLRAGDAPWPKSIEELSAYITGLIDGAHTYGTCVYAASLSATAAFNYVCGVLGMTGFQASCADLDVLRRTRGLKGPFMLLKAEDALYPQHDLHAKLNEALNDWQNWLSEEAAKRLKESSTAHPDVIAHWTRLAVRRPTPSQRAR